MKIQLGPKDIIFPVPAALVVSGTYKKPNIITVSWIGMMSSSPSIIGISLERNRYSFELINKQKEFSVNIPSSKLFIETDYCGIVSGRNTDKFKDTGLTPLKSKNIVPPIIQECPFNMECIVVNEFPFKKYLVFFGEIIETHIDADKIDGLKTKDIDISKVDPLVYCATIREYWSIGKKLGNSFSVGKNMKTKK
ncbi:MAG: flavin reductase family protein [Bacteroidota bacterium]|jgi:flavin reductase (DIM6/NTAB) family NADH-FMN oxidoreductase RutF